MYYNRFHTHGYWNGYRCFSQSIASWWWGVAEGKPLPKDEKGVKEWIRNKLKALASLLGILGIKAAEALPGIIWAIISWILNRAAEVVGWVSQNLRALVVSIGGLLYMYMVMKK